jgi:hypothetical protein
MKEGDGLFPTDRARGEIKSTQDFEVAVEQRRLAEAEEFVKNEKAKNPEGSLSISNREMILGLAYAQQGDLESAERILGGMAGSLNSQVLEKRIKELKGEKE